MRNKAFIISLLTAVFGFIGTPWATAQTTVSPCPAPCPTPCPVKVKPCPAPCPQRTPVSSCPVKCNRCAKRCPKEKDVSICCPPRQVSTCPPACPNLHGEVSQAQNVGWNDRAKTLTLQPGAGQFTIDHLHPFNTVLLTLVNPTDKPLLFETTQRWAAHERAWVVDPHSQRTVSFMYTNPISDEVKFLVTEEPCDAMARNTDAQRAAWAACQTKEAIVVPSPVVVPTPAVQVEPPRIRSTVRGYW